MLPKMDLTALLRSRIPDEWGAKSRVAREARIDGGYLTRILKGEANPTTEVWIRLLTATGLPKQDALAAVLATGSLMTASEVQASLIGNGLAALAARRTTTVPHSDGRGAPRLLGIMSEQVADAMAEGAMREAGGAMTDIPLNQGMCPEPDLTEEEALGDGTELRGGAVGAYDPDVVVPPEGLVELARQLGPHGLTVEERDYLLTYLDPRNRERGAQRPDRWSPEQWFKVLRHHRDRQR